MTACLTSAESPTEARPKEQPTVASKKDPYETKSVSASFGDAKVQKLVRQGWEVVSDRGGFFMTARTVILRRPNPNYRGPEGSPSTAVVRSVDVATATAVPTTAAPAVTSEASTSPRPWYLKWWVLAIAAVILIGLVEQLFGLGRDTEAVESPSPSARQMQSQSAAPSRTPQQSEEPSAAAAATAAEVIAGFDSYYSERRAAGVLLAAAITDVSFIDGTVHVVFDPEGAGFNEIQWTEASRAFDNLAEFAGVPIAFADDAGKWLRTAVTGGVATFAADGTSLGTLTTAELFGLGTGHAYTPGS